MEYEFIKKHPVYLNGHEYKVMEVRKIEGNASIYVGQFSGKTYKEIKNKVIRGEEEEEEEEEEEDSYYDFL